MQVEGARILLVEDNAGDVYLFRKALSNAGVECELVVIEDAASAMAFARGEGKYAEEAVPDLIVLDLNLPGNDGTEVLQTMRAAERFANVPVLMESSLVSPPERMRAERLNVAGFIAKPLDLEDFLQIGVRLKEVLLEGRRRKADGKQTEEFR